MAVIGALTQWPAIVVYVLVAVLVGSESLGVPLPGETSIIAGVLLATSTGSRETPFGIFVAAVIGGVLGDNVGYFIGRKYGARMIAWIHRKWPRQFTAARLAYATHLFREHGQWTVFFGRFVALLRMLAGPLSGSLRLLYRRFFVANVAAVVVWSGTITLLAVWLGKNAKGVLSTVGWVFVVVLIGVIAFAVRWVKRSFDARADAYAKRAGHSTASPG